MYFLMLKMYKGFCTTENDVTYVCNTRYRQVRHIIIKYGKDLHFHIIHTLT